MRAERPTDRLFATEAQAIGPLQNYYVLEPNLCPYLPGRTERKLLTEISGADAQPRYDLFDVLQVEPGIGFTVRGGSGGDTMFVRERQATRQVRRGATVLGALFPDGDGLFVMGGACAVYPPTDPAQRPSARGAADLGGALAPIIEQQLHDASREWIHEIDSPAELRRRYEAFAATLRATGTTLPGLAQLQRRVREMESPVELAREAVRDIAWWTEMELGVFAAFLQCLWNLTPLPDPDEPARGPAAGRSTRASRRRNR